MKSFSTRRGLSLAATLAVAAGSFAIPAVAMAAPGASFGTIAGMADTDPGQINAVTITQDQGNLHIYKHKKTDQNGTTAGTGLQDDTVTGDALGGVTFRVQKLNLDLKTQAAWEQLANQQKATPDATAAATAIGFDAATDKTEVTAAGTGLADFSNLPVGAYLVTETITPAGVTPSSPFIVTIPMTHPTNTNQWLYDVYVYPKNTVVEADKTVSDVNAPAVGDKVTYTIKSDIPNLSVGETLKNYQVVDPMDERLTVTENDVKVALEGSAETLTKGADYTLYVVKGTDPDKKTYVTVEFTEAGRAKILEARRGGTDAVKVVTTIDAVVNTAGTGDIKNKAYVIPNEPTNPWTPNTPPNTPPPGEDTPEVVSKFGKVSITKVDATNEATKLDGAKFSVFQCNSNGAGGYTLVDSDNNTDGTQPLTINGKTEFETTGGGQVTIDGLRNNDWYDNKEQSLTDGVQDYYCLVEVKAPDGYELQTTPIPFQITQTSSTVDNGFTYSTTVKDVPKNGGFKLPLTGAQGVILLTVVGAGLVLGGGFLAVASRRKKEED